MSLGLWVNNWASNGDVIARLSYESKCKQWNVRTTNNHTALLYEHLRLDFNCCLIIVDMFFLSLQDRRCLAFSHTHTHIQTFPYIVTEVVSKVTAFLFSRGNLGVFVFFWGGRGTSWYVPDCIISSLAPKQSEKERVPPKQENKHAS